MPFGDRVDELDGHPHLIARAEHRALHDRVDAQLGGDVGEAPVRARDLAG
jgi:hypothetical protein